MPPGGSTTGKLYFDVVGDVPNSVVYNDGVRDVLAWVPGPPVGGYTPLARRRVSSGQMREVYTGLTRGSNTSVERTTPELSHDDDDVRDGVREVVRFSVGVAFAAAVFAAVAALWVSTCGGSTADLVACGAPQRTLLALGAPIILLLGGLRAFVRTWHAAGWFLLTATLVVLATSMPAIAGF